jgi:multidrug resistance protein, MATE family
MLTTPPHQSPILAPVSTRTLWLAELRAIVTLSCPLAVTNLAQTAMGTTDMLMMGWLGAETLTAGTLAINLYLVALIFGIGLTNATAPLVAHDLGRDPTDYATITRTVQQACWAAVCISIPSWCVLWWTEPILRALGQDARLAAQAGVYMHTLQWALLPFLCFLALRSFVAALERPAWALFIGIAAVLVNALGNWCLMLGHCGVEPMGIAGSGLATTLTSLGMFVALALVVVTDSQFKRYGLLTRFWHADWSRFRAIWRLGLPLAAALSFEVTIFIATVFLMGLIGSTSLAAHAIAIQLASLTFMIPLGIGQAATVRVALAYGSNDHTAVGRSGWTALGLTLAVMVVLAMVLVADPARFIGAFLDIGQADNAPIVAMATSFLMMAAIFQIVDGAQCVGAGMLRGLQDSKVPMYYALLGYWGIGLPLGATLAFGFGFGGIGLWIGLATGLAVVAGLIIARWTRRETLGLVKSL